MYITSESFYMSTRVIILYNPQQMYHNDTYVVGYI